MDNMYEVMFLPDEKQVRVSAGTSIYSAALAAGVDINAPCGGNGKCSKCMVTLETWRGKSDVLACETPIECDAMVYLPEKEQGHIILDTYDAGAGGHRLAPLVTKVPLSVGRSAIGGAQSDWDALTVAVKAAAGFEPKLNMDIVRGLRETLIATDYAPEAVFYENTLLALRPRDLPLYAMAFDIGTTTVVGYLLDLETGERLGSVSALNPQHVYGADVIQRAGYCAENGVDRLRDCIREELNGLIGKAAENAGVKSDDILLITLAGNTCMNHLFLGISPAPLAVAPYLPILKAPVVDMVSQFGLSSGALLAALPNIGGFVGADTVSAIIACDMDRLSRPALLVDIGTNGELAIGDSRGILTCSTAAGPAFEGALIECGMRGASGAIDHLSLSGGEVSYSVIGDVKPTGICGSGLVDAIAALLGAGIVDSGGRLCDDDELTGEAALYKHRLSGSGGGRRFDIAENVYITQKDIRELQLAKGAMAAGIQLLMKEMKYSCDDIDRVMIAGAFGNYMSPDSACAISLIPPELRDKVVPVGNAAGQGAQMAALDRDCFERALEVSKSAGYLELAVHPDFQEIFVENLEF